jgi:precorrin isomerase
MSLFADGRYQWRETYFVLFDRQHRPQGSEVRKALADLAPKVEVLDVQSGEDDRLESMTILAHADAAGMDVTYVEGDEVKEQIAELKKEWKSQNFSGDEKAKVERALHATARLDVYHFEELGDDFLEEEEEDHLDPAALLTVLSKLARLCHGVAIDPQSGTVL